MSEESNNEARTPASGESWKECVARVYDQAASKLVLYGRALGLSHGESEDVLHDVFAALLRRAGPPENLDHYVVRAFRNRVMNHRRGWWRRVVRELESRHWFEPAAPVSPQEATAIRCLAGLPVEQREAVVLKVWHGKSFDEIGALQEISANTAAGRYRYGLQKLRRCLKDPAASPEKETDHEYVERARMDDETLTFLAAASAAGGNP